MIFTYLPGLVTQNFSLKTQKGLTLRIKKKSNKLKLITEFKQTGIVHKIHCHLYQSYQHEESCLCFLSTDEFSQVLLKKY